MPNQILYLEGESSIEEKQEFEYTIETEKANYKLIIIKDAEKIEIKLINLDNLQMYCYYNNYSLIQIILNLKLNSYSYKSLDQIIKLIDEAYSNNNIIIDNVNKEFAKLKFSLIDEKSNKYDSILVLNKKDYKIKEKFGILINELNSLKKKIIDEKLNDIEMMILDIKNTITEKMNQNLHFINLLKEKNKINEDIIKDNKNIIQSLKQEIKDFKELIKPFKEIINPKTDINKKLKENDNTKIIKDDDNLKLKENDEIKIKENKNENNSKITEKKEEEEKIIIKKEEKYKIEKLFDSEEKTKYFFSILLLGDSQVGKSWIFENFLSIPYTNNSSICLESEEVCIKINDEILSINIGDCPGQESFNKINLSIISNMDLIIFVYSIDNKNSFENLSKRIKEVKDNCKEDTHFLLVGNKSDLDDNRLISKEEGNDLAKKENMDFFIEASAKTGENIDNIFFEAAKILYKNIK